jgi:hypothetical protein
MYENAEHQKGRLMKPGIKKIASGKTKRVATVFTGAAACAAAFVPAAHAANGHQAGLDGKTLTARSLRGTVHGARPDSVGTSGSIQKATNCADTPKWVHLAKGTAEDCFGFPGVWSFSVGGLPGHVDVSKICGGNNYGWYASENGKVGYYHQGTTYAHLPVSTIRSIGIFGYKGTEECPAP